MDDKSEYAKIEPEHVTHAKKTIAGWPEWKRKINCSPIPVEQLTRQEDKQENINGQR